MAGSLKVAGRRARSVVAVAGAVALLFGAAGGGVAGAATKAKVKVAAKKSAKKPASTGSATTPVAVAKVVWAPCGSGVECGVLNAPLDYTNRTGQTIALGVARRSARQASQRIGVLIVNPGGPAGSAFDFVTSPDTTQVFPAELLDRFDIVGIDPRGVNRSIPVLCAVNPSSSKDRTIASREFSKSCGDRSGAVLDHVGTDSSAEDLETLRASLGEQQITYLGFSYGTYLGGLYAQAHPDQVRAMILDGWVDPARFGMGHVEDKLRAQERTLAAFFAACKAAAKDCALTEGGKDPRARYEEMLLIASHTGIGTEKLNRDDLEGLTGVLLGEDWEALNKVLGDLSKGGTGSAMSLFGYLGSDSSARYEDGSFEGIACRDGIYPSARPEENVSPAERLTRFQAAAPHFLTFADYWANDATCAGWPSAPRSKGALTTTAGNKIVVIGNTLDIRTPYEWSRSLANQLGGSMVTFRDYVHTAALSGEECITGMTTGWLVNLTRPAAGLTC